MSAFQKEKRVKDWVLGTYDINLCFAVLEWKEETIKKDRMKTKRSQVQEKKQNKTKHQHIKDKEISHCCSLGQERWWHIATY